MTNEEKILARLDELTLEIREAKQAIRPYVELKQELEPLVNDMVISTIGKLSGLDRRFDLEDILSKDDLMLPILFLTAILCPS